MKLKEPTVLLWIMVTTCCLSVEGARILAVVPVFASSHHRFFQPLMKALARAGHDVVVYSPFPLDKPTPNYTDVFMDNVPATSKKIEKVFQDIAELPHYKCLDVLVNSIDLRIDHFIESAKVQKLLTSNERFDLVITEAYTGQEFQLVIGQIFKCQVIVLQAYMTNHVVNSLSGNTLSISHIPDTCSPFSNKMTFVERLYNAFYVFRNLYYLYYNKYIPVLDQRVQEYFPGAPPIMNMVNNVSLVFVNDHQTADYAQPRTPNIIPVAGIHIEDVKPLPTAIKRFMDEAIDGVILFSLGTYVPDERKPREYFDMYINVFRKLRQRVLWKTRKENIQGLPNNVMTLQWAPQQDVLAHPNCVLFITHGGLLSQHEAIHFGVPVVVIPQFYDQYRNGRFYEEQGIGVRLHKKSLTESTILSAVRRVLENTQFKTNMKILSRIFRDRPMTPAQTVVYWTEYVLRHGASHLRPASTQLSWYQLALLDVLAVVIVVFISVVGIAYFICRMLFEYLLFMRKNNLPTKEKR